MHTNATIKRKGALRRSSRDVMLGFFRCCFDALRFGSNEWFLRLYMIAGNERGCEEKDTTGLQGYLNDSPMLYGHEC
jgi:hypothetical protein